MEFFPGELIIEQLLKLPIQDILRQCQISRKFRDICNDDYLWLQLLRRDYPTADPGRVMPPETYRQFYFENSIQLPIYYNMRYIKTQVFVTDPDLIFDQLTREAQQITQNDYIIILTDEQNSMLSFITRSGEYPSYNQLYYEDVAVIKKVYIFDTQYNFPEIAKIIQQADNLITQPGLAAQFRDIRNEIIVWIMSLGGFPTVSFST